MLQTIAADVPFMIDFCAAVAEAEPDMAAAHRTIANNKGDEHGGTASSGAIDLCSSSSSSDDDGTPDHHQRGDGEEGGGDCGCRFYAKFIYPELGKVLQQGGRGVDNNMPEEDLKADVCNRDERWVTLGQLKLGVRDPQFLVDLKDLPEVKRRVGGFSVLLHSGP